MTTARVLHRRPTTPATEPSRFARARRRSLWLALGIGAFLAVVGFVAHQRVETAVRTGLESKLLAIRKINVTALEILIETYRRSAEGAARNPEIRALVTELAEHAHDRDRESVCALPQLETVAAELATLEELYGYEGHAVVDLNGRFLCAGRPELVGRYAPPRTRAILERVARGETVVTPPFRLDAVAELPAEVRARPLMIVAAPVRNAAGEVRAGLGFPIDPQLEFSTILAATRMGSTGETFAFDEDALLLSESRFESELARLGLLEPDEGSVLNVVLREPVPRGPAGAGPLTRMAESALQGLEGVDVEGYRDYRGERVVGAWTWLTDHGFGIATKMDTAEAFRPLVQLRTTLGSLFALLAVAAIVAWFSSRAILSLRQQVHEQRQLGQYTLEELLGGGGMGAVYRARHAWLRRPTAVKVLKPEIADEQNVARFEREVQLTSELTHPNTIAIYDYGRTAEDLFYYAMEFLPGAPLDRIVERTGPLAPGRVAHVMAQVAGSLGEAHANGLIHRDVKPSNVMLCERGGVHDVVKVLDFGLVRPFERRSEDVEITSPEGIAGTPVYMAPEAFERPTETGPAVDVYALGALGFYLLAGSPPFTSKSWFSLYEAHRSNEPGRPSERLGQPLPEPLENVILACLAKDPDARPTAVELVERLRACVEASPWTEADAERWWRENGDDVLGE